MLEDAIQIVVEDVMRAIHLKSFDYRVLNLLLYQLRGEKVYSSVCLVNRLQMLVAFCDLHSCEIILLSEL